MAVWASGKPRDDEPTGAGPSASVHAITLEGILERVTYVNEESAPQAHRKEGADGLTNCASAA